MSAPPKPWEGAGSNLRSSTTLGIPGPAYSSSSVSQIPPSYRRLSRNLDGARIPPPIPSRVTGSSFRQAYNRPSAYGAGYGTGSYGGGYGGGTASAFGGYGTYGGSGAYGVGSAYGSYGSHMFSSGGYGMNRYARQQGMSSMESRFIQMAEENSRPAFESIESLVQAFGSVSFMMESTFHAMYSSFRAVLGVAENFGRLRSLFGQVFQTFAILRLFQWIYRKLLYYLGIRHDNPGREAVWKEATGQLDPKTRRTFWPVAMFLSLVCGGPFLVWRLLKSISNVPPTTGTDSKTTTQLNSPATLQAWVTPINGATSITLPVAVALYDFTAARENELTMKHGQPLLIAPSHLQTPDSDWLLVTMNWKESGLVPVNYVHVIEHRTYPKAKQDGATVTPPDNPASSEITPESAEQVCQHPEAERLSATPLDQLPVIPEGQVWAQNQGSPMPPQPPPPHNKPHAQPPTDGLLQLQPPPLPPLPPNTNESFEASS